MDEGAGDDGTDILVGDLARGRRRAFLLPRRQCGDRHPPRLSPEPDAGQLLFHCPRRPSRNSAPEQIAESANASEDFRPHGALGEWLYIFDKLVTRIDIDAGIFVGQRRERVIHDSGEM